MSGFGFTKNRRQKINSWEDEVHVTGAKVDDVTRLESIIKRPIILYDIAGEHIHKTNNIAGINPSISLFIMVTLGAKNCTFSTAPDKLLRG